MTESRITDPKAVSRQDVQAILDEGQSPTIQFSGPGYSPSLLSEVNELCKEFGAQLEVRFYAHYSDAFDAANLAHLPNVRWLSVDCLERIRNEAQLFRLERLERFSFGVHFFSRPDFLSGIGLETLHELSLSATASRNFNLAPLGQCRNLSELFLQGHTKNIDVLASLPKLASLRLSGMPKQLELSFLGNIEPLRSLTLLLGGRSAIDEVKHAQLAELRVIWVRGLETLGDLHRFPALRLLHVEDQLRLRTLSLAGPRLRELSVHNCKNLELIEGLDRQGELEHFRASRTNLDLNALLARDWPPSVRVLALYSSSEKWNRQARAILDQRGYGEFRAQTVLH